MIIGLTLLALVAALLIFGVAKKVFASFGVPYYFGLIMIAVFIGCAFVPTFSVCGISVNAAGFIVPLVYAVAFMWLALRAHETKAIVSSSVVAALYISTELLLARYVGETLVAVIAGLVCGAAAYAVGRTKTALLASVFVGIPLGSVISSAVELYVSGSAVTLGSAYTFDCVIISAVFGVVMCELFSAIKRVRFSRAKRLAYSEQAEEFDPNEYKRYFDD